jgi:putative ABC transport system permease protein
VPVENVRPLQALVGASIALPRFQTMLLGVFGGCALLLSVVGVSGVVAYGVSRRTREIAIRIALGAQAHDVARAVLGPTGVAVGIGLTLGLLATAGLSRIAQAFLYEIGPNDPLTLATVVAVLATAAVAAAIVPARRILAIDPVVALRSL